MKVRDVMVSPVATLPTSATLGDAARVMLDGGFGSVLIVDEDGRLAGILTQSDFVAKEEGLPFSTFKAPQLFHAWLGKDGIERIYAQARSKPIREFMTPRPATVTEEEPLRRVVDLMLERDVNRVPVVRDGRPVGIVSRHDLLGLMMADIAD